MCSKWRCSPDEGYLHIPALPSISSHICTRSSIHVPDPAPASFMSVWPHLWILTLPVNVSPSFSLLLCLYTNIFFTHLLLLHLCSHPLTLSTWLQDVAALHLHLLTSQVHTRPRKTLEVMLTIFCTAVQRKHGWRLTCVMSCREHVKTYNTQKLF